MKNHLINLLPASLIKVILISIKLTKKAGNIAVTGFSKLQRKSFTNFHIFKSSNQY